MKLKLKLVNNREIKNASWIIGEQVFQMVVSLILGMISARYLGPDRYGELNYTASFISFFTAIANLGMENVIIKKMIAFPDKEGEYLGSALVYRLISSVLSGISILIIIYFLNPEEEIKLLLAALQILQLVFQAGYILDSWFQRHLKSKYVSIAKSIACVIVAAYRIYILVSTKSIIWFAFTNSLTYIVVAVVLFIFYRRQGGEALSFKWATGNDVLKDSYHFIISGMMVAIYGQMDKIMIGKMIDDKHVGYYTTAAIICGMWTFVPNAIINSLRPGIMEHKENGNEEQYMLKLQQLYSILIWFCLSVSAVVFIFSPLIVQILYGKEYLDSVPSLRILIWREVFAILGTARGIWLISENKNKYIKYLLFIGAVLNLILNYILIPICGIDGASIATLLTQITTCVIAPLFFKGTRMHTYILLEAFTLKWYFKQKKNKSE